MPCLSSTLNTTTSALDIMYSHTRHSYYTAQPLSRGNHTGGYALTSAPDTDYLVAQEEAAIRRRLADIESQRQQAYYQPSFGYDSRSYEPQIPLHHGADRLAALRREVELEEQRYAAAAQRQEERALEAKLLAARQRRQLLEQTERSKPAAPLRFSIGEPIRKDVPVPQRQCARFSNVSKQEIECPRGQCHRSNIHAPVPEHASTQPPFLDLFSSILGGAAVPSHRHSVEPSFEDVFGQILQAGSALSGQAQEKPSTVRQPEMPPIQDFLSQIFGAAGPSSEKKSEPIPSTSSSAAPKAFEKKREAPQPQDFLSQLLQLGSGVGQQKAPDAPQLQDFFSQVLQLGEAFPGGNQQRPQQSSPTVAGPSNPTNTLKEELEARLLGDESPEIKDTIREILASLVDPSAQSVAAIPVPAGASFSGSPSAGLTDEGKGKAKAESRPVSPTQASSALNTINNIAAAFSTLESEFSFPSTLDFATPSSSPAGTPASSDTEASSISRLAFTSRNQPVRYFEQSLSGLISQLDEIETEGNEELRSRRKELVGRIEKAIDELDEEIEGRWKSKQRKEEREREERENEQKEIAEASAREAAQSSETVSEKPESLAASEVTVRPYDTEDAIPTVLDSFLLNSSDSDALVDDKKKAAKKDSDSDWSEVDA